MMEPEEIFLRAGLDVVVLAAIRLRILTYGICSLGCTVETDTLGISLVIIHRAPFQRIFGLETIRFWSIVMVEFEYVVQAEWHHVVDTGFS